MILKILVTFVSATLAMAIWIYRRDPQKLDWLIWFMVIWNSILHPLAPSLLKNR